MDRKLPANLWAAPTKSQLWPGAVRLLPHRREGRRRGHHCRRCGLRPNNSLIDSSLNGVEQRDCFCSSRHASRLLCRRETALRRSGCARACRHATSAMKSCALNSNAVVLLERLESIRSSSSVAGTPPHWDAANLSVPATAFGSGVGRGPTSSGASMDRLVLAWTSR